METKRFVSKGHSCRIGDIRIPNTGYETSDPKEIEFLSTQPELGRFYYEVPSTAQLKKDVIEQAKKYMAEEDMGPVVAPPLEKATEEELAVEEPKEEVPKTVIKGARTSASVENR